MTEMSADALLPRIRRGRLTEHPPIGVVPPTMLAQVIRPHRYGEPATAFAEEEVDTPRPGPGEALVYALAAGVNYNNVWAALGRPVDVIASRRRVGRSEDFHICWSDASGFSYAVGAGV